MSEEYLSGFCPRCGEALTVPAKLSEFSCMFCGARLSLRKILKAGNYFDSASSEPVEGEVRL